MARRGLGLGWACVASLLAACAGSTAAPGGGASELLRWAATEDGCPPLTLLAGEYRRAVLARDTAALGAFLDEEALRCDADRWIPAEPLRRALLDRGSFLSAALFDGALLRSGRVDATGYLPRTAQAELLGSEALEVSVTDLPGTHAFPRRARVGYRVAGTGRIELGFECRGSRWVLDDWGGLECHAGAGGKLPHPPKP